MYSVNANNERFEAVEILGIPGLFTTQRIDRASVPQWMYAYDMQTSPEDWSQPCLIARRITVEHFGTVLTASPVPLPQSGYLDLSPGDFDENGGVEHLTVAEFEEKWLSPDCRTPERPDGHRAARSRPVPVR